MSKLKPKHIVIPIIVVFALFWMYVYISNKLYSYENDIFEALKPSYEYSGERVSAQIGRDENDTMYFEHNGIKYVLYDTNWWLLRDEDIGCVTGAAMNVYAPKCSQEEVDYYVYTDAFYTELKPIGFYKNANFDLPEPSVESITNIVLIHVNKLKMNKGVAEFYDKEILTEFFEALDTEPIMLEDIDTPIYYLYMYNEELPSLYIKYSLIADDEDNYYLKYGSNDYYKVSDGFAEKVLSYLNNE